MGPSETATATTGALEKLTFLTGTGRHRAQISYFFRMQNGSRTPFRVDLVMGSRLHRVRRRLWVPEGSESKTWGISAQARCLAEHLYSYVSTDGKPPRMRCRRLHATSTDPRRPQGAPGPQIDRIRLARPA